MPRTPKVIEDRREQIIDAAMRVFAEKGFTRATNRDVAKEAGITTGLIYYYFENKEAVLKAVLEARSPIQIIEHIDSELLEQPPEVFLPILFTRMLNIVENEQFIPMIRVILSEVLHNQQIAMIVTSFIQRALSFLSNYLQVQTAKGIVRSDLDPALLNQIVFGAIMGFVLRREILHDPAALHFTRKDMAQAFTDILLDGIQVH